MRRCRIWIVMGAVLLATSVAAAPAQATWMGRPIEAGVQLTGISCPSATLCVVADVAGNVVTSSAPTSGEWKVTHIGKGANPVLTSVSCEASLCVAVGNGGYVYWSANPTSGSASDWTSKVIDSGHTLLAVSCGGGRCVATDDRGVVWDTSNVPGGTWTASAIDLGHPLRGVSCVAATRVCYAVDDNGYVFVGGSGWGPRSVGGNLRAISCASASLCAAVDDQGDVKSSNFPGNQAFPWRTDAADPGHVLNAVSCPADGHDTTCMAVDDSGNAVTSGRLGTSSTTTVWAKTNIGTSHPLTGLTCLPSDQCYAVDSAGDLLWGAVPPANEEQPSMSDPMNSLLVTCDRGTWRGNSLATSYQWYADGAAIVGATGTAYNARANGAYLKCRVTVSNSDGSASAESEEVELPSIPGFSTSVVVDGKAAAGSTLECVNEGVYGTPPVSDHLQWLRDGNKIAGATSYTYIVAPGDAGHLVTCTWRMSNPWGSSALVTATPVSISTATGPKLRTVRLGSTRFKAARSGPTVARSGTAGVKLTITLSSKATVTFTVERATLGRRQGSRCLPDTKARRKLARCTYYALLKGSIKVAGKSGANAWRFTGRLGGHALKPGRYRLVAVARASNGAIGPTSRVSFTITR